MKEVTLSPMLVRELEEIYRQLQLEYGRVAGELGFSCTGCPDNCCDSYFLHHTYAEWAYLWQGFCQLDAARRDELKARSQTWLAQCEMAQRDGERPQVMCPLNEGGLCILYHHRLLVCRTHGVPASMIRPDGQTLQFPGCFRCQELVDGRPEAESTPRVERTRLFRQLALLEGRLLDNKRHLVPKVRLTIAEMLIKGPPTVPLPHCERQSGRG
jgi:hypothetical protein